MMLLNKSINGRCFCVPQNGQFGFYSVAVAVVAVVASAAVAAVVTS
jgi:hypothetical protein